LGAVKIEPIRSIVVDICIVYNIPRGIVAPYSTITISVYLDIIIHILATGMIPYSISSISERLDIIESIECTYGVSIIVDVYSIADICIEL
jgi:hypothetical protein